MCDCNCGDNLQSIIKKGSIYALTNYFIKDIKNFDDEILDENMDNEEMMEKDNETVDSMKMYKGKRLKCLLIDFILYFLSNFIYEKLIVDNYINEIEKCNEYIYGEDGTKYCMCKVYRDLFILLFRQMFNLVMNRQIDMKELIYDAFSITNSEVMELMMQNKDKIKERVKKPLKPYYERLMA